MTLAHHQNAPSARPKDKLRHDLLVCFVIVGTGAFSSFNIAKLAPALEIISTNYGLSLSQVGLLASILSLMTVALGLALGAVSPGFGARRMLMLALIAGIIGGIVSTVGNNSAALFIGRIIEGIALIITMLVAPVLLTQNTNPSRRGLVIGLWGGFMPLGNAMALFLAPALISASQWQSLWHVGIVAAFVLLIFVRLFIPADNHSLRILFDVGIVKQAMVTPILTIVGFAFVAHGVVYQTLLQLSPLFLQQMGGASFAVASFVVGAFCVSNFAGNVATGRLIDRGISVYRILTIAYLIAFFLILFLAQSQSNLVISISLIIPLAMVSGAAPPVLFYLVSGSVHHPKQLPAFMGWMLQIQGFGLLLGPSIVSLIVESTASWSMGLYVIAGASLCLPIVAPTLKKYTI